MNVTAGYMDGALQAGERAAAEVAVSLQKQASDPSAAAALVKLSQERQDAFLARCETERRALKSAARKKSMLLRVLFGVLFVAVIAYLLRYFEVTPQQLLGAL